MSAAERFEMPVDVRPEHIDELGHVNNVVYLQWIQDVAVAHWQARATPEDQAAFFWVVSRHEIDYFRPAFLNTHVTARTWVGEATEREFERHTELRRGDGKLLVRARTLWVPVDPETLRRKEASESVRRQFSTSAA